MEAKKAIPSKEKKQVQKLKKEKKLSKKRKLLKDTLNITKTKTNQEITKSIRMNKEVANKLKLASTLSNMTQGELIEHLLNQYMDLDEIYEKKLKPLLKKIKTNKIELLDL